MVEEFEILDPEEYTGGKQSEGFSFGGLVMASFRKAVENGSKEMKEGYWNTKFDRMGNAHRVWVADSRQEFIESVESARMLLGRDLDDEAEKELKKIDDELKERYNYFCEMEKRDWQQAPIPLMDKWRSNGSFYREGMLSNALPYFHEYISENVKGSRKIVTILGKLVSRLNDFGEIAYSV